MVFGMAGGGVLLDLYGPRPVMGLIAASIGAIALGAALPGVRPPRD